MPRNQRGQTQEALDFTQLQVLLLERFIQGTFVVSDHIRSLIMRTEIILKMVSFDHLTWLMAPEYFIKNL